VGGGGGGGGGKTNKRPNFYFEKRLGVKKFSSWGIGGIKQEQEESNFQDRMMTGASSRVYICTLHLG